MKYEVSVEDDDRYPGCYMVVIYSVLEGGERQIVGIPCRQSDRRTAKLVAGPSLYAFDYGMREMRRVVDASAHKPWHIGLAKEIE